MTEFLLKYLNPNFIIALGAAISIVGGYLAAKKGEIDSQKTENKIDLNNTLANEIKRLTNLNNDLASQNNKYAVNNELYINQLNDKADAINNELTGGNNVIDVDLSFTRKNEPLFLLSNNGENKIENIQIVIYDKEKLGSINHLAKENPELFKTEYEKCYTTFFLAIMYPNSALPLDAIQINKSFENIYLSVEIHFGKRYIREEIIAENYKNINTRIIEQKLIENDQIVEHYRISANPNLPGLFDHRKR